MFTNWCACGKTIFTKEGETCGFCGDRYKVYKQYESAEVSNIGLFSVISIDVYDYSESGVTVPTEFLKFTNKYLYWMMDVLEVTYNKNDKEGDFLLVLPGSTEAQNHKDILSCLKECSKCHHIMPDSIRIVAPWGILGIVDKTLPNKDIIEKIETVLISKKHFLRLCEYTGMDDYRKEKSFYTTKALNANSEANRSQSIVVSTVTDKYNVSIITIVSNNQRLQTPKIETSTYPKDKGGITANNDYFGWEDMDE